MSPRPRASKPRSDQDPTRPARFSRSSGRVQKRKMPKSMIAVTDGREAASSGSPDDMPSVELLASVLRSLERFGYAVIVVVDEELRHEIERSRNCATCLDRVAVALVPDRVDRESLVLAIADGTGASVVSNERFEDHLARFPWLAERRIPYRVYKGQAYLDPEELMGVF